MYQSVGGVMGQNEKKPTFFNLCYGGLVVGSMLRWTCCWIYVTVYLLEMYYSPAANGGQPLPIGWVY